MNKYKTFVPRFFALILDTILLFPLAIAADALTEASFSEEQRNLFLAILNIANVVYFVVLHGMYGQTAGKYLMKVKVVTMDEGPIGFKRAFVRSMPQLLLVIASVVPAMNREIGGTPEAPLTAASLLVALWGLADVLVFLFHPKRRALHDLIAGTVVVRLETEGDRLI